MKAIIIFSLLFITLFGITSHADEDNSKLAPHYGAFESPSNLNAAMLNKLEAPDYYIAGDITCEHIKANTYKITHRFKSKEEPATKQITFNFDTKTEKISSFKLTNLAPDAPLTLPDPSSKDKK